MPIVNADRQPLKTVNRHILALLLMACWPLTAPAGHFVRLIPVATAPAAQPLPFSGVARAQQRATLAFQVSGQLKSRSVFVGSRVQEGEKLAELSNPQLGPAVSSAEARIREIEARQAQNGRDLRRVNQLFKQGAATREEREQLQAQRNTLAASKRGIEAQLQQASQLQQETVLYAPFSGQITALNAEPGEFLQPGVPVLELLADGALEVELAVPERVARQLEVGTAITLRGSLGEPIAAQGKIIRIASAARGQLYPVVVSLPGPPVLRAGQVIEALLPRATNATLAVPVRSIIDTGSGQPRVYRLVDVQQGEARGTLQVEAVVVVPQGIANNQVLVSGELKVGDQIVLDGLTGLVDGMTVEIAP